MVRTDAWLCVGIAGMLTAFAQGARADDHAPDFSWAPGNYGPAESLLATRYFTPELRLDIAYNSSFNSPSDDTISGSSNAFRSGEFQLTQIGLGGDFKVGDLSLRLMTQFGMYSAVTPGGDSSPLRGQWDMADAYRYFSEAYASYHLDALKGINIQAGIFPSFIGLWSYYNFDNWTYQPSYLSSNMPWYFNGMRVQIFASDELKIEPWLVNGWQSYGRFGNQPGIGLQVLYRPSEWISALSNHYYGADTLNDSARKRVHTDDSVMVKYHDRPGSFLSKAAASFTVDAGCEFGDGQVGCGTQYVLGFMVYNRFWFDRDRFGLTLGGGTIDNPGRYLVLLPPINGAAIATGGTSYFPEGPGFPFSAWDSQVTLDYMPSRNVTFRLEFNHREASVPYFTGAGGVTPPGGNQGLPGSQVPGWSPDLTTVENRLTAAFLVRL